MQRTNANPEGNPDGPIDVWLKFESPEEEEASHEANIYHHDNAVYRVEWYHTAVGQVSRRIFATYEEAAAWLARAGFQDFTVVED